MSALGSYMAAMPMQQGIQGKTPQAAIQGGYGSAIASLQNALNSNQQAYTGLQNQAQQQLQQNQGAVQQNLVNSGLGNTTVAQTMQQAPLQTYNNALLNIMGQQQGAAANIYGQQAGQYSQEGNALANYLASLGQGVGIPQSGVQYNRGPGQATSPF